MGYRDLRVTEHSLTWTMSAGWSLDEPESLTSTAVLEVKQNAA